jgi:hypothetical protein
MTRAIDITRARMDTPGVKHVLHFNNAGAALMSLPVHRVVERHLALERDFGGYEAEERAQCEIDDFYAAFAASARRRRSAVRYSPAGEADERPLVASVASRVQALPYSPADAVDEQLLRIHGWRRPLSLS